MYQDNRWRALWFRPRETIRRLIETDPNSYIIPLALINGFISALSWLIAFWIHYPQEKQFFYPLFVVIVLISGIAVGIINLFLEAFLFRLTGSWLGGKGTFVSLKCAVGWGNYLFIISGIFGLLSILLANHPWAQFPFNVFKVTVFIWGFIVLVKMVAEAHSFSSWRSLLSIAIAFLIIFLIIMSIFWSIAYFSEKPFSESLRSIEL